MQNAGLDEAQAVIKIAGRSINNLRYADDTTVMAESEELKSLLLKVKEEPRRRFGTPPPPRWRWRLLLEIRAPGKLAGLHKGTRSETEVQGPPPLRSSLPLINVYMHSLVTHSSRQHLLSYLSCVCAKSLQSCPTLCDPMDCSLPGYTVHGIFQARILEWVPVSFSRGSSRQGSNLCLLYLLHWQAGSLPLVATQP